MPAREARFLPELVDDFRVSEPGETYPEESELSKPGCDDAVSGFIGNHGRWSLKWCHGVDDITHVMGDVWKRVPGAGSLYFVVVVLVDGRYAVQLIRR